MQTLCDTLVIVHMLTNVGHKFVRQERQMGHFGGDVRCNGIVYSYLCTLAENKLSAVGVIDRCD